MKQILVINSHPDKDSFGRAIAESYAHGAMTGVACTLVNLSDLKFDPILHFGYRLKMPLEPDLIHVQELIKSADHIVFVFPTWWGTYPALLKGFFDRIWLPGFAYRFHDGKLLPEQFLRNKTGRIITTMNTPAWFHKLFYGSPGIRSVRDCIMKFCGIRPVRVTIFSPIEKKQPEYYERILSRAHDLGRRDAKRLG